MKFEKQGVINFLKESYGVGDIALTPAEQGEWSQTYFYTTEKGDFVIRLSHTANNYELDRYAYKYSSEDLPIPEILDIGKFESGYYAISTKLEGGYIEELTQDELVATLPAFLQMLDRLKGLDVSDSIGYGDWNQDFNGRFMSWKQYLLNVGSDNQESLIKGWRENLESRPEELAKFNQIFDMLGGYIHLCPEERHVIHGDLLHYNLLLKHYEVSAVLDWGCAKYGDFLYDVAWIIFWSKTRWHKNLHNIDFLTIFSDYFSNNGIVINNYRERLYAYSLHMALDIMAYLAHVKNWERINEIADFTIANNPIPRI